ncbi:MAG: Chemotaxis response regulator protein-glutamate methylesterase CheB, partial [uncultured Gemmatimonadetes bacterium]
GGRGGRSGVPHGGGGGVGRGVVRPADAGGGAAGRVSHAGGHRAAPQQGLGAPLRAAAGVHRHAGVRGERQGGRPAGVRVHRAAGLPHAGGRRVLFPFHGGAGEVFPSLHRRDVRICRGQLRNGRDRGGAHGRQRGRLARAAPHRGRGGAGGGAGPRHRRGAGDAAGGAPRGARGVLAPHGGDPGVPGGDPPPARPPLRSGERM